MDKDVKIAILEQDNERMRSALMQLAHYSYHTSVARDIASRAMDIPQSYTFFQTGLKVTVAVDDTRPGYARIYQEAYIITEEHFKSCMHNRQLVKDHMSILSSKVIHEMAEHGAFEEKSENISISEESHERRNSQA